MQQITNQKFESLREQLATSYKHSQIFSARHQNQLTKSSLIQSQGSCLESSIVMKEEAQQEQGTIQSSFKSQRKKKQLARVTQKEYDQKDLIQSIRTTTMIQKIIMIQRNYRRYVFAKQFHKKIRLLKNRKFVVAELYQIEKNYNGDLELIVNKLMKDIRKDHLLTEEELLGLFLNVEQILSLNEKFYKIIEGSNTSIQEIVQKYHHFLIISAYFKILVPFFKIYYDYCSRFQLHEVSQLRKKRLGFNQYIESLENNNVLKGLTFESFLVKPVQQLPRYVLLIEKLLKYTESSHPDYAGLKFIQEQFCKINSQINQMMSTTQSNLKLLAQFGTLDKQEIELIQKKKQEEEIFLKNFQNQVKIDVISFFKQKEGISRFIVYIIEIQINTYRVRTYQRFSNLLLLQQILREKQIEFDELSPSCFNAITERKLIQQRQLQITDFLRSLFLHKNMQSYQDLLISHLDLPENFLQFDQQQDVQTTITMRGSYTTQMRNTLFQEEEIEVVVNLSNGKSVTLQVVQYCKCLDLIETVCKSIFLETNFDFKLMVIQNNQSRYLDDNEVVYKVMNNYNIGSKNFVTKLINSAYMAMSSKQKPVFYLRKYLYLCQDIEMKHFCENKIRSSLLFYQELTQLRNSNLSQSDYVILASLIISINQNYEAHQINYYNEVRSHWFEGYLPQQIFENRKKDEWKRQIFAQIKSLLQQVEIILKQFGQKDEIKLLEIEFLNSVYKNKQHRIKLFPVGVVHSSVKLPSNIVIGIIHNCIHLYNLNMKLLYEIQMKQVIDIKLKNEQAILKLEEGEIILQHSKMFEVYRLLEDYQQINLLKMNLGVGDTAETNESSETV